MTTTTQGKCIEFINNVRENRLNKIKERQVSKFNRLINKPSNKDRDSSTQPSGNLRQFQQPSSNLKQSQEIRSQSNQFQTTNNINKWVINLSKTPLTPARQSLLAKGPNFVVTPLAPQYRLHCSNQGS